MGKGWIRLGVAVGAVALLVGAGQRYGLDAEAALRPFRQLEERLGMWAIPVYVAAHTLTLALCLPYAVFFEAGASLLFGFLPAVLCVFSAKVLGASLSFWIGRFVIKPPLFHSFFAFFVLIRDLVGIRDLIWLVFFLSALLIFFFGSMPLIRKE